MSQENRFSFSSGKAMLLMLDKIILKQESWSERNRIGIMFFIAVAFAGKRYLLHLNIQPQTVCELIIHNELEVCQHHYISYYY